MVCQHVAQAHGFLLKGSYHDDITELGEFTKVGVPQSIGLAWDAKGNLYVSSYKEKTIRKYDAEGNDMGIFLGIFYCL